MENRFTKAPFSTCEGRWNDGAKHCRSCANRSPRSFLFADQDVYEPESIVIRFRRGADSWAEIKAMQQVDEILKRHEGAAAGHHRSSDSHGSR